MFFRETSNKYAKNKVLQLVENRRTPKGIKQKVVVSLGSMRIDHENRKIVARIIEDKLYGMANLYGYTPEMEDIANTVVQKIRIDGKYISEKSIEKEAGKQTEKPEKKKTSGETVEVFIDGIKNTDVRILGPLLIGEWAIARLELERIFEDAGLKKNEINIAKVSILSRLTEQVSENRMGDWLDQYAYNDLNRTDVTVYRDKFYRIIDVLLPKQKKIEEKLWKMEQLLFDANDSIYLYDLTNSYFEGQAENNSNARYGGHQKEKRNDCKQTLVGLVIGKSGAIKRHKIYEGNRSEIKTLIDVINDLKEKKDKRPTVIMDKGIASKANLEELKKNNIDYVVAHRGGINKELREALINKEPGKIISHTEQEIKLTVKKIEKETFVICQSEGRRFKNSGIRTAKTDKYESGLIKLKERIEKGTLKEPEKIHEAIGRLKEKYRCAHKYFNVHYDAEKKELKLDKADHKIEDSEKTEAAYVLRTNKENLKETEIWELYTMLTRIERAFKDLKSSIKMRPFNHQKTERVSGHIFICVLAYHLLHFIERKLRIKKDNRTWITIKNILSTHNYTTQIIPCKDGTVINRRTPTVPETKHKQIYDTLDIKYLGLPVTKIYA